MRIFLGTLFGPKFGPDGNSCDSPCHSRWVLFWCRNLAQKVGYTNSSVQVDLKSHLTEAATPECCTLFSWLGLQFPDDHDVTELCDMCTITVRMNPLRTLPPTSLRSSTAADGSSDTKHDNHRKHDDHRMVPQPRSCAAKQRRVTICPRDVVRGCHGKERAHNE